MPGRTVSVCLLTLLLGTGAAAPSAAAAETATAASILITDVDVFERTARCSRTRCEEETGLSPGGYDPPMPTDQGPDRALEDLL